MAKIGIVVVVAVVLSPGSPEFSWGPHPTLKYALQICLGFTKVACSFREGKMILLIEEILHQLIGSLSHYLQDFFYIPGGFFSPDF